MPSTILLLLALPLASSLECLHNSTVTNAIYNHGMLIRAYTSNYNLGVLECSEKLTRCVVFKAMDISFFQSLDVAQDQSIFVNLIKVASTFCQFHLYVVRSDTLKIKAIKATTEVAGRACMSEADTTKIAAQQAEDCLNWPKGTDCYCTTDECTGSASRLLSMLPLIGLLMYLIH